MTLNLVYTLVLLVTTLLFVYTGVQSSSRELTSHQSIHNPLRMQSHMSDMLLLFHNTKNEFEDSIETYVLQIQYKLHEMKYVHSIWFYYHPKPDKSVIVNRTQLESMPMSVYKNNTSITETELYEDKIMYNTTFLPIEVDYYVENMKSPICTCVAMIPLYF